jgi:hypothetical protein
VAVPLVVTFILDPQLSALLKPSSRDLMSLGQKSGNRMGADKPSPTRNKHLHLSSPL